MADPSRRSAFGADSAGVEDCESVHEAETGNEAKKICRSIGGGGFGDHARGMDLCGACVGAREPSIGNCKNLSGSSGLGGPAGLAVLPVGHSFTDTGSFQDRLST